MKLDDLKKIAEAATKNKCKYGLPDVKHVCTFTPELVLALLEELTASRMLIDSFHVNSSTSQRGLHIGYIAPFETAREATDKILGELNG